MIWIYIALCLLILIIEVPGLIKQQHYRDLYVFMFLLVIGFFMGLAFFLKWPLFAPFAAMTSYFGI
ncbi:MAG: hypothetical protein GXY49_04380 [Syntrophomonadaceae bacterium]|nr:hypothetical protein [Syntrophomonadaceae bacterium]